MTEYKQINLKELVCERLSQMVQHPTKFVAEVELLTWGQANIHAAIKNTKFMFTARVGFTNNGTIMNEEGTTETLYMGTLNFKKAHIAVLEYTEVLHGSFHYVTARED